MPPALQILLIGCLWSLLIPLLLRAIQRHELNNAKTQSTWIQLLLASMVFTLQGEVAEQVLDRHFGGFPMALYWKYFGMLLWFYLYYRMLQNIFMASQSLRFWKGIFVILLIVGVLSIPMMVVTDDRTMVRDVMTGVRDAGLLLPTVVLFVPLTWKLWKQEQIKGMQTKQLALLICYSTYAFLAVGNIANALFSAAAIEMTSLIEGLFAPFLVISCIAFLLLFLPFRWLSLSFIPSRLIVYLRLKRLERLVLDAVTHTDFIRFNRRLYLRPNLLELEIYRTVIHILDHYLLLTEPSFLNLRLQIEAVVQKNASYSDLVEGLLRVRSDRTNANT
jgi:hypothetical protein